MAYEWSFGDGTDPVVTAGPTIAHAYTVVRPTVFGWSVTVVDDTGGRDSVGAHAPHHTLTRCRRSAWSGRPVAGGRRPPVVAHRKEPQGQDRTAMATACGAARAPWDHTAAVAVAPRAAGMA